MSYENKTIYVQISAGRGPAECCWVVAQVLKKILADCQNFGIEAKVIDRQEGVQNGTLFSALIAVSGVDPESQLGDWKGTVQWIGQSPFRKFHKRKNWFIGVSFFKEEKSRKLNLSEVTFKAFRASGPGGQHRNKVETAVRATHVPTGISASSCEARSQHQNKQKAIERLKVAVNDEYLNQQKQLINDQWMQHLSLERGNAVKVFQGRKFEEK